MKTHYSRYTIDKVSDITGISPDNLLRVDKAYAATGNPEKSGTILNPLGWIQHTVGVQNIRSAGIVQLLLGNMGVTGGGINALRGEPNIKGSTDHALLYHIVPGYMAMPLSDWQTLADYHKALLADAESLSVIYLLTDKPDRNFWWEAGDKNIFTAPCAAMTG